MSNVDHETMKMIIEKARQEDSPECFVRGAICILKAAKIDTFSLEEKVKEILNISLRDFKE